jgi:hypothetical protein
MNEAVKTCIYAGVAVVLAGVAFLSRPRQEDLTPKSFQGKVLFPAFDDPDKAAGLEIVRYDAKLGELHSFRVARDKTASDAWAIPSHSGYPAEAKDRMKDAALLLVDLKILDVASEIKGDHKLFGVVAPDKDKLEVGTEGVGDLVVFEDKKGQQLASLVVGKKVKGADSQRFVRVPTQDIVYIVKVDPEKLSTKFEDWIEKDLLKLSSWDIENVRVKTYTVARAGNRVALDQKLDLAAKFDNNEWKLQELITYRDNEPRKGTLGEGEELNKDKLNDLKTAVDELAIVDVRRKPKGLGADLKAGEGFMKDQEGLDDLFKRGFYPVQFGKGEPELLSANGEAWVGTKEGVEYVLRFGETVAGAEGESDQAQNRYLFVTARVDMSKFPEPELQALPDLPAGKTVEKPKEESKPATKEKKEGEGATAAKPTASADEKETKAETSKPAEKPAEEKPTESAEKKAEAAPAKEASKEAAKPEVKKEEKKEDAKPEAKKEGKKEDAKEAAESEIVKKREEINKENQKKIDERNEKVKKAKEKVAELNVRFADWYYVVADKEYKKIHLDRSDLIKLSDKAKEEGTDVDAFRKLEKEGLKK